MKAKRYFIFFAFTLFGYSLMAQNVHLSQFEASPLFLNPALGGQYYGDWQAGVSVREQWRSIDRPYQSFVGFFDQRFHFYSQEFSAGIVMVHDRSGAANLTSEKVYLSLAYPIRKGRSTISIGMQGGVVMRLYNDYITYPAQFDQNTGYFNRDLPNNESGMYGNTNRTFADVNAGIFWTLKLPKITPSIGISLFHLNQADESFNKVGEEISIRQNIHADIRIKMQNRIYLRPAYYFSGQKKANEMLIGGDVGKKFSNKDVVQEIFAGLYFRNGYLRNTDSFSPKAGFQKQNWRFGISYDINISTLEAATGNRGAFELSVIYRAPSTSPKHTTIPCDRY